jgi:uncharacterized protein
MTTALQTIEGYASLFGVADLSGDVVHACAFARTTWPDRSLPLLLEHDTRLVAGRWNEIFEDRRGLFVRGEIRGDAPAGRLALTRLRAGVDGLSIGFSVVRCRARADQGRDLLELTLHEVSLVRRPMLPSARLMRPIMNSSGMERTL